MTSPIVPPDNTAFTLAAAITASQSFTGGLVANSAGTQAAATPLPSTYNEVITVGGAGYGALLPLATALGQEVVLISKSATSMQVFGSGTDTINGVATATGVAVVGSATGKTARFICDKVAPAGNWVMTPAS